MVTQRAAKTTVDPKMFDFNSVLARSKAPTPNKVSVFLRPDLVARIQELDALLEAGGDSDDLAAAERSIGELLTPDQSALVAEYDALVDEFNASELIFEFRPQKLSDHTNARAAMVRDGIDLEGDSASESSLAYMLAQTCLNAGWSGSEWAQWREAIGEAAFLPLVTGALEANAAGVSVPFSRRPLPGLTNER